LVYDVDMLNPGNLLKSWEPFKYRILVSITDIGRTFFITLYDSDTKTLIHEVFNKTLHIIRVLKSSND